jgi:hypothetical protein
MNKEQKDRFSDIFETPERLKEKDIKREVLGEDLDRYRTNLVNPDIYEILSNGEKVSAIQTITTSQYRDPSAEEFNSMVESMLEANPHLVINQIEAAPKIITAISVNRIVFDSKNIVQAFCGEEVDSLAKQTKPFSVKIKRSCGYMDDDGNISGKTEIATLNNCKIMSVSRTIEANTYIITETCEIKAGSLTITEETNDGSK